MAGSSAADPTSPEALALAERYGRAPSRRRPLRLAAVVVAVLAAVGLGWVAWGMLQPGAEGDVARFEVVDDARVDLVLEVTRPVGSVAVCTIEALGDGHAQVGLLEVTTAAADTRVSEVPVTLATSAEATVAVVRGCRLA